MPSKNPEIHKRAAAKHWEKIKNDEEVKRKARERAKAWYEANKEKAKKYMEKNKEKRKEQLKAWKAANPERVKEQKTKSQKNNMDSHLIRVKRYQKTEKGKIKSSAIRDAYRSHIKERTLKKYMFDKVIEMYRACKSIQIVSGTKHHLDHICPIKGNGVSGLHVFWNLRIVSAYDNQRKTNKVDMDLILKYMWEDIDKANAEWIEKSNKLDPKEQWY